MCLGVKRLIRPRYEAFSSVSYAYAGQWLLDGFRLLLQNSARCDVRPAR